MDQHFAFRIEVHVIKYEQYFKYTEKKSKHIGFRNNGQPFGYLQKKTI